MIRLPNKISPALKVSSIAIVWFLFAVVLMFFATKKIQYNTVIITPPYAAPALLQSTFHWDSGYYLQIAQNGYATSPGGDLAFFPLYPLAINIVSHLTGNLVTAAFLVNVLGTILASLSLYSIAQKIWGTPTISYRAVLLFLFFPSAYFLAGVYGEALFCGISFAALELVLRQKWGYALLLAMLASAIRLPGLLVSIAVAIAYWQHFEWRLRSLPQVILYALIASAGFIVYMLYLTHMFGSPLILKDIYTQYWPNRTINLNIPGTLVYWLHEIVHYARAGRYDVLLDRLLPISCWFLAVGILWKGWKTVPSILSWYGAGCLLLFAITRNPDSMNRYVLTILPMYLILAKDILKGENRYGLWLGGSAAMFGLLLAAFANNYWTG